MSEENEMAESDSLVRARELGDAISTAMTRARLDVGQVASALDWPYAKLVRFLAGRGRVDQIDLIPLLALCMIPAAYADIGKGSCTLLEFAEADPVVHLERLIRGAFLTSEQDIATYRDVFAVLAARALDEGQSRELIANRVVELYEDRE